MNETLIMKNGDGAAVDEPRANVWFTPRFDLVEDENEYVLIGDLPGVDPQALDVKYENRELTIYGKVSPRYAGECFVEEYGVGDFRRSFTLSEQIDGSLINAELKDGVVTIHLPKRPEAKPRKIAVRGG
jgi:HSP20 family protein